VVVGFIMETPIADLVEIGICTRNRWRDLQSTLEQIRGFGWAGLKLTVIDDGSDQACDFDLVGILPKASLIRHEVSAGYISRRNELAQIIQSKYYLSLDDDSYPIQGDLSAALEFAESKPNLLCLGFAIRDRGSIAGPTPADHVGLSLAAGFIGCGHLLSRQTFLNLGGYYEPLFHQGEELEIAARGFYYGKECWRFPGCEIYHNYSQNARNYSRMDFYGSRNKLWWLFWYCPGPFLFSRVMRSVVERIYLTLKTGRTGHLRGTYAAFAHYREHRQRVRRFSREQFKEWNRRLCRPMVGTRSGPDVTLRDGK